MKRSLTVKYRGFHLVCSEKGEWFTWNPKTNDVIWHKTLGRMIQQLDWEASHVSG